MRTDADRPSPVPDDRLAEFRREGLLVLPGFLHGEELSALVSAIDALTDDAVAHGKVLDERAPIELTDDHGFREWQGIDETGHLYARDEAGRRVWRRSGHAWARATIFRTVTAHPVLLDLARRLVHEDLLPIDASVVAKMPGAGAAVPWHRDPPGEVLTSTGGDSAADLVFDLYVDDSTVENGCLWAIPGSHRWSEPERDSTDFDRAGAVPVEARRGDLVLHATGVVHGSPPNRSPHQRRTLYLYFGGPDWYERFSPLPPGDTVDDRRALLASMVAERAAARPSERRAVRAG